MTQLYIRPLQFGNTIMDFITHTTHDCGVFWDQEHLLLKVTLKCRSHRMDIAKIVQCLLTTGWDRTDFSKHFF